MSTRRQFLGSIFCPGVGVALTLPLTSRALARAVAAVSNMAAFEAPPEEAARDEDFWIEAQQAYTIDRSVINLNNGGVCPAPATVQAAMQKHLDFCNSHPPPVALWEILGPQVETVRSRLARQWHVDAEEIALTRNASESMQICQFGVDLKPGDEILATTQDYGRMLTTFRQRAEREKLNLNLIEIPVVNEDNESIVKHFADAITERTKLILVTHVINITGQVLPVAALSALGRKHGIPVVVDGAQSFAIMDFTLDELDCDYFGTSLHKWLCAPHGTGLLYVRRDRIKDLWPLMAASEKKRDDIRKFEEIGTNPAANRLAIAEALTFHQALGPARKAARLRYLRDTWVKCVTEHDRVRLHTSLKPGYSCGFATMQIEGVNSRDLSKWLWHEKQILVAAITHEQFEGIRVTPNVYTTLEELDRFCDAIAQAVRDGVPAWVDN